MRVLRNFSNFSNVFSLFGMGSKSGNLITLKAVEKAVEKDKKEIYCNQQLLGTIYLSQYNIPKLSDIPLKNRVTRGGFLELPEHEVFRNHLSPHQKLFYVNNALVKFIQSCQNKSASVQTVNSINKAILIINAIHCPKKYNAYNTTKTYIDRQNFNDSTCTKAFNNLLADLKNVLSDSDAELTSQSSADFSETDDTELKVLGS